MLGEARSFLDLAPGPVMAGRCLHAIGNVGLFVSLIISNQTSRPYSRFTVMQKEAHEYHACSLVTHVKNHWSGAFRIRTVFRYFSASYVS